MDTGFSVRIYCVDNALSFGLQYLHADIVILGCVCTVGI